MLPDLESLLRMMKAGAAQLTQLRQRFTLGTAAGALGALLCRHDLQVDEVLAFTPQIRLDLPILRFLSRRKNVWRIPSEHRDQLTVAAPPSATAYALLARLGRRAAH